MPTATARYFSVDEAAHILRCNKETIYRNLKDVPHIRQGGFILIPCEWLGYEPPAAPGLYGPVKPERWFEQPMLPFEVKPQRRWRNTNRLVSLNHFGEPV